MRKIIALLPLALSCTKGSNAPEATAKAVDVPTVTRWVGGLDALRFKDLERPLTPTERIPIGTKILVETAPHTVGGRTLVRLAKGGGYVDMLQLYSEPPTAAAELTKAHEHLLKADLAYAVAAAQRAEALDPEARAPLLLLQAIYDAKGSVEEAKRVYEKLAKMPAAKRSATKIEDPADAPEQGTAYVGATILNLRKKPKRRAPVLRALGINDRVEIVERKGDWARVEFAPRSAVLIRTIDRAFVFAYEDGTKTSAGDDEAEDTDVVREAPLTGWVAARFLRSEALEPAAQIARADEHEKKDEIDAAMTYIERAARLDRTNTDLLRRLIVLATGSQRYRTAVWAAQTLGTRRFGSEIRVEVAYGCRGAPTGDWVVEGDELPEEGCVIGVDLTPVCEPRYEEGPTEIGYDGDDFERDRKAYEGSDEQKLDEKRNKILRAEYELEDEKRTLRLEKLDAFEDHPYLRATIVGPADARSRKDRLFIYSFDTPEPTYCTDVDAATGVIVIYDEAIDWPDAGETLTVYAELPEFTGSVHGVIAAESADEVREMLRGDDIHRYERAHTPEGVYQTIEHHTCVEPCGC